MLDQQFEHLPVPTPPKHTTSAVKQRARLTLLKIIGKKYRRSDKSLPDPQKILLVRPDHLGDLIFLTPTLRYLRNLLPNAHLTLMTGPWGKAVVENNPHLDQLLLCEFPGFTRRPKASNRQPYQILFEQARLLRSHQFDQAIILRFDHWWGAWLTAAAGIPQRIGYAIQEVAPFLTHALPYTDQRHEVEQNWRLAHFARSQSFIPPAESWPLPDTIGPTEFFTTPQDELWAAKWIAEHQLPPDTPIIVIHPGAGAAVKFWRIEAWAKLAQSLIKQKNCRIILSGGPDETELCQLISAHLSPAPVIAAGKTTLSQLAAIFKHTALVIAPDTGPVKLAAAVGTPTLQLYGPVDAIKFGPWGNPKQHRFITSGIPCIPCNHLDYDSQELARHFCVRGLSVQSVLQQALDILNSPL